MDAKCAQNLKPAEIVSLVRAHGRTGFVHEIDVTLLLVRLDDPEGDFAITLEAALEEAPTSGGRRPEASIGFETIVGSLPDTVRSTSVASHRPRAEFSATDLNRQLQRLVFFAVPLQKRRGATNIFTERISVGRARTNDIVLRHHSVSKFHGWFECDEDDRYYLCDAKSTNATMVNGVQIPKGSPTALGPGDEVRFGEVVAILCPPEVLWDALMLGGAPRPGGLGLKR